MTVAAVSPASNVLWGHPRAKTLVEILTFPGTTHPNLDALAIFVEDTPRWISWGELLHGARVQAEALLRAGVRRHNRVMVMLPTSREYLHAFFGALLAGAIPVPCAPPASTRGRGLTMHLDLLRSIVISSSSTVCVAMPATAELIRPSLPLAVLEPANGGAPLPLGRIVDASENDIALLQYSSGSTSAPKGVVLTHRNLIANLDAIAELLVEPDTVSVSWLPLHHDMGLIGTLLTALYTRVRTTLMPPHAFVRSPARWLRAIAEQGATVTAAPNFAFRYCVDNVDVAALRGARLGSLRAILNGAEPVDAEAIQLFQTKFAQAGLRPNVVRPVYGLAENTLAVTFANPGPIVCEDIDAGQLEASSVARLAEPGARSRRCVSVGRPVPGVEVRVAGESDEPMPDRHVGQIIVRGASVTRGYFCDDDATAAALADGWLHTGDLGYIAGGQLFVTGRLKDVIIRHGRNYYPSDIEHHLGGGSRIGTVAAFGVEGESETEIVVAAETRCSAPEELEAIETELRAVMHDAFSFGPSRVVLLPPGRIPRTTSGKLRRGECRRLYMLGELPDRRSPWSSSST